MIPLFYRIWRSTTILVYFRGNDSLEFPPKPFVYTARSSLPPWSTVLWIVIFVALKFCSIPWCTVTLGGSTGGFLKQFARSFTTADWRIQTFLDFVSIPLAPFLPQFSSILVFPASIYDSKRPSHPALSIVKKLKDVVGGFDVSSFDVWGCWWRVKCFLHQLSSRSKLLRREQHFWSLFLIEKEPGFWVRSRRVAYVEPGSRDVFQNPELSDMCPQKAHVS